MVLMNMYGLQLGRLSRLSPEQQQRQQQLQQQQQTGGVQSEAPSQSPIQSDHCPSIWRWQQQQGQQLEPQHMLTGPSPMSLSRAVSLCSSESTSAAESGMKSPFPPTAAAASPLDLSKPAPGWTGGFGGMGAFGAIRRGGSGGTARPRRRHPTPSTLPAPFQRRVEATGAVLEHRLSGDFDAREEAASGGETSASEGQQQQGQGQQPEFEFPGFGCRRGPSAPDAGDVEELSPMPLPQAVQQRSPWGSTGG